MRFEEDEVEKEQQPNASKLHQAVVVLFLAFTFLVIFLKIVFF